MKKMFLAKEGLIEADQIMWPILLVTTIARVKCLFCGCLLSTLIS